MRQPGRWRQRSAWASSKCLASRADGGLFAGFRSRAIRGLYSRSQVDSLISDFTAAQFVLLVAADQPRPVDSNRAACCWGIGALVCGAEVPLVGLGVSRLACASAMHALSSALACSSGTPSWKSP